MSTYYNALKKLHEGFTEEDNQRFQKITQELRLQGIPTITLQQFEIIAKNFLPSAGPPPNPGSSTPPAQSY